MLTLTRQEGESIIIYVQGKTVEVWLDKINGSKAKISNDAPYEVEILRKELVLEDNS